MSIKVLPLEEAIPGFIDSPRQRSSVLSDAGREVYWCLLLLRDHAGSDSWYTTFVPMMRQAMELLTKALVVETDVNGTAKPHGHGTLELMQEQQGAVPIFAGILGDPKKVELITQLETAHAEVSHGETTVRYDAEDIDLFVVIAEELVLAYGDLTGLR